MRYPKQVYFEGAKNFYKRNYVKATEIITPKFYLETDNQFAGQDIDILDEIINTHINIASRYSDVIISSIGGITTVPDSGFSSINTITGLSQFFVKQNNLTDIDANDFERKILLPLGQTLKNFQTSSQFRSYLVNTLLPSIALNVSSGPTEFPVFSSIDGEPLNDGTYDPATFNKHSYLIANLSWLYFLNVSGPVYDGSTIVADAIIDTIWSGKNFMLNDAMKCLTEYIFRNYSAKPDWAQYKFLPRYYRPNLQLNDTTYTSGLQQLDKLKTLIDVIYSPLYADRGDTKVKEAFDQYIENQILLNDLEIQGPFYKFLKAISYAFADYNNSVELLEILNDVNRCPDAYLPYIADLLGWNLLGSEPKKWRVQLINSISIYKMAGTKKGLQTVIDSTFSQDLFNTSAQIEDLWESYIPNLIYYSLATESTLLKDYSTWTREEADRLEVTYSLTSIDECIRCAVDKIILDVAQKFSFEFWINGRKVSVNDPTCNFNYRGRDYKVPPFEEYPFYLYQKLDKEIINLIADKLICFGVREEFADQVANYIIQNSILSQDEISLGFSWLIFTNESKYAPNWDSVLLDVSNKKPEYMSLWSGKSSHFKVFLNINSFNFIRDSILINSSEGLRILGEIIDEFSPAHSIKQVYFRIYHEDFKQYSNTSLPLIFFEVNNDFEQDGSDTLGFSNYEVSGNDIRSYKRGLTSNYNVISRDKVDSLTDSSISGVINAPRKSFRRRNYKNILDTKGVYLRNGFNMPTTFEMEVEENSYSSLGFLPLGLIPSSQTYVRIPGQNIVINEEQPNVVYNSWRTYPDIYSICQGLNSNSIFSGLIISSTFPCRGLKSVDLLAEAGDYTVDRGQLNSFFKTLHYISERWKDVMAFAMVDQNPSLIEGDQNYKNSLVSLANVISNGNSSILEQYSDYENFKLGKELHKVHRNYCTFFDRHVLTKKILELDGPNIFAHIFGSIYRNSKFNIFGSAYATNKNYITSSLLNEFNIRPFEDFYPSAGGGTYNSFYLTTPQQFPLTVSDLANSSILAGIDFIHSMNDPNNYFTIYNLLGSELNLIDLKRKPYAINNYFVKLKSGSPRALPRLRFDLKRYVNPLSEGNVLEQNFLIPEHNFKVDIKSFITSEDFSKIGGGSIGVWIHTDYEEGGTWVYMPNRSWQFIRSENLSVRSVKLNYAHKIDIPIDDRTPLALDKFCRNNSLNDINLYDVDESFYVNTTVRFNTKNQPISVPEFYYKTYQQVHRKNQNYYIEIFLYDSEDKVLILNNINVIDDTLNKWSQPLVSALGNMFPVGDFNKKEYRVLLDKDKIYYIFKYFTEITGSQSQFGLASRIASITSDKFEANGGSRLNYRLSPDWLPNTKVDFGFDLINYLEIEN